MSQPNSYATASRIMGYVRYLTLEAANGSHEAREILDSVSHNIADEICSSNNLLYVGKVVPLKKALPVRNIGPGWMVEIIDMYQHGADLMFIVKYGTQENDHIHVFEHDFMEYI
jgi:hypothetical protein